MKANGQCSIIRAAIGHTGRRLVSNSADHCRRAARLLAVFGALPDSVRAQLYLALSPEFIVRCLNHLEMSP